eukprot:1921135-Pyramimonas_sp.AAC.1
MPCGGGRAQPQRTSRRSGTTTRSTWSGPVPSPRPRRRLRLGCLRAEACQPPSEEAAAGLLRAKGRGIQPLIATPLGPHRLRVP